MPNRRLATTLTLLALTLVSCGGGDGGVTEPQPTQAHNTPATTSATPTTASLSEPSPTVSTSAADVSGGFAVLIMANVNEEAALAAQDQLSAGGFRSFSVVASANNGFNLIMPGLSPEEAGRIAAEIIDSGVLPFAAAWDMSNLP